MKHKKLVIGLATGATLVLGVGGYVGYKTFVPQPVKVDTKATVSSNYYQAVNKKWLEKTKIPSDKPAQNSFSEISDNIQDTLKSDVKDMLKHESDLTEDQKEFVKFYKLATDYKQRDKEGAKPIKARLEKIESLKSFDDFVAQNKELMLSNFALPYAISVGADPYHSDKHMLDMSEASTILPDISYYQDEATKKQLLSSYQSAAEKTLTLAGYSEKEAKQLVKDTIAFDALMVPYMPTSEEMSDVTNNIHIIDSKTLSSYSPALKLDQLANNLVNQEVPEVNVTALKYFKALDKIVNEKNFDKMKSWMLVNEVMSDANVLSEDMRQAAGAYSLVLNGTKELASKEDNAFELSTNIFGETFSVYYGQKHFGETAKKDVDQMVSQLITVYKQRLTKNTWLSDATKAKAVQKLDKMTYRIGYPDKVSDETKAMKINADESLVANLERLLRQSTEDNLKKYSQPVDKTKWGMASYEVNAYYDQQENAIVFPAAVLQAPFYNTKQSAATNYGGIGAVIGHEITHAFDNNGAKFDENGNLTNWWTKEDTKAFDQKTKQMEKLFNGIEIYGEKVNGKLTVSENIADAGGLSAAYEALHDVDKTANDKQFFENWATIWRQKSSLQYAQLLIRMDSHAPNELRANVQLKNFTPFYDTYHIKSSDDMYLPKDKRVSIW